MKKLYCVCLFLILILFLVFTTGGISQTDSTNQRILKLPLASMPRIDPATGSGTAGNIPLPNLYDSLVFPSLDGPKPLLAKNWKVSNDGLKYTFYLREGVRFHNGDELTAEDVVFSMKRVLKIGEGFASLFIGLVEDVVEVDKHTVEFILTKPSGPFISTLVRFYVANKNQILENLRSGSYGDMGDYGKEWLLTHDAGSGPYMVKGIVPEDYLYIERYDDYWGGWDNEYAPVGVRLYNIQEGITIRTMLQNKELEMSGRARTTEDLQAIAKIHGVEIGTYSTGSSWNVMLNNKIAPTDDINFRKAISYLWDYDTISKKIFPGCPKSMGPVDYDLPGHNHGLYQYSLNIDEAKEYLQKSKYGNELDRYPLELVVNSAAPDQEKVALMFQAEAKKVGITVNISKNVWLNIVERVSRVESTPHMVIISVSPTYEEAGSLLFTRYHSRNTGRWQAAEWLQNEEIDKMIDDAISTVDREERFAKYKKIQEILVNDIVPSVWLVDINNPIAYRADYVDWPIMELIKQGKSVGVCHEGFYYYFKDFKMYPENM